MKIAKKNPPKSKFYNITSTTLIKNKIRKWTEQQNKPQIKGGEAINNLTLTKSILNNTCFSTIHSSTVQWIQSAKPIKKPNRPRSQIYRIQSNMTRGTLFFSSTAITSSKTQKTLNPDPRSTELTPVPPTINPETNHVPYTHTKAMSCTHPIKNRNFWELAAKL